MQEVELEFVGVTVCNGETTSTFEHEIDLLHETAVINSPTTINGVSKKVPSIRKTKTNQKAQLENSVVDSSDEKLLQCCLCQEKYSTIIELEEHMSIHFDADESPLERCDLYECNECGASFKTSINLVGHRRMIHNTGKPYNCSYENCGRSFTRSEDLHIHHRIHRGLSVFECCYCDRMFAQSENLANHIKNSHKSLIDSENYVLLENGLIDNLLNPTPPDNDDLVGISNNVEPKKPPYDRKYKCPLCNLSFIKMRSLEIHCNRNHVGEIEKNQLMLIERNVNESLLKHFKCTLCMRTYETNKLLIQHLKLNHPSQVQKPFKCCKCNTVFAQSDTLLEHLKIHNATDNKCKYCSFTYFQSHSLLKHLRKHEGPDVKHCEICDIPYCEQKDLDKHMRTHANGKPHKCPYCDKYFAQSCDKMKHIRIHTKERPYECEICHKKFAHLTSIRKHQIVHSGERNFQCFVCGKSFQHKSNLVVHNRTHTGERPFKCEICSKSFYASGHYTEHMKIHTGEKNYKCDICDKKFLHQNSFQKHKKMHTGAKNHECSVCFKKFSQPGHFREHLRIHSGEMPYDCQICNKAFRRADALKTHMKTHQNINNVVELEDMVRKEFGEIKATDSIDSTDDNITQQHPAILSLPSTQIIEINTNELINMENGNQNDLSQQTELPIFIIRQPLIMTSANDTILPTTESNSIQPFFQF